MSCPEDNDGRHPDGSLVLVRYPRSKAEEQGDRAGWPWLAGTMLSQCGPDEWEVCVEAREVAVLEDGSPAPDGTPDDDMYHPLCFRDASELRPGAGGLTGEEA